MRLFLLWQANKFLDKPSDRVERERAAVRQGDPKAISLRLTIVRNMVTSGISIIQKKRYNEEDFVCNHIADYDDSMY